MMAAISAKDDDTSVRHSADVRFEGTDQIPIDRVNPVRTRSSHTSGGNLPGGAKRRFLTVEIPPDIHAGRFRSGKRPGLIGTPIRSRHQGSL
jgi:hypothetical protein